LKSLRRNQQGLIYLYIVLGLALVAGAVFYFVAANIVGTTQETLNPKLGNDTWIDSAHYDAFALAAQTVTNIWNYFIVFLVIGLIYFGYIMSQREGQR
jgi:uncharacterized membrane protein